MKEKVIKHFVGLSVLASGSIGIGYSLFGYHNDSLAEAAVAGIAWGGILIYPFVLTFLNLFFLLKKIHHEELIRNSRYIEYITLALGSFYTLCFMALANITFGDWTESLVNNQVHTPVWTEGFTTVLVLYVIGLMGYLFLSFAHIRSIPPLITVCAMAAMYLGIAMCILWMIQVFCREYLLLCLLPFNCIVIAAKTIRYKITEWKRDQAKEQKTFRNKYLNFLNQKLIRAESWPLAAFFLMWPMLGIVICILVLFGQRPDSVVKAWTETSDWNLSKRIAVPSVYYDEHYLCTVAAGGPLLL